MIFIFKSKVEAVKRVRRCKNYYEILGLSKDASDADLKKAYRCHLNQLFLHKHKKKNTISGNLRWLSTPTRTRRQEPLKPSRRSATLTQFSRTRESGGNMISMAAMKNRQQDLQAGVTIAVDSMNMKILVMDSR